MERQETLTLTLSLEGEGIGVRRDFTAQPRILKGSIASPSRRQEEVVNVAPDGVFELRGWSRLLVPSPLL